MNIDNDICMVIGSLHPESLFKRYYININNQYFKTDYFVNQYGEIYSSKSNRIMSTEITNKGYYKLKIRFNNRYYRKYPHIMVAETFISHKPHGKSDVNHKDGNKKNNHVSNLEWTTRSENLKHAIDTGLRPIQYGENHNRCKYPDSLFKQIAIMRKNGMSYKEISDATGMHLGYLKNVLNGNAKSRNYIIKKYLK